MRKTIFLFLWFVGFAYGMQDTTRIKSPSNLWQNFTYDVGSMFTAVGDSYLRPIHWNRNQWAQFGGVIAGTGLVYLADDETSRFARAQQEGVPNLVRDYGEFYGNPANNYLVTGGVYLTGLFSKNEKLRRTGVLLVASATSAGLLQQVLKSVAGRARPAAERGKDTFDPFNSNRNYHSFPSGHALLAFTNAYAIGKQFKNPWVKAGIYTLGAVPGISRIWEGQHWLSDVVLSFAISVVTVESIDRYLDKKYSEKYNDPRKKLAWDLKLSPRTVGVSLAF